MTNIIVLIVTTLLTTGYAALMPVLADRSPELAAVGAIIVLNTLVCNRPHLLFLGWVPEWTIGAPC